jgi:hypothetical protein
MAKGPSKALRKTGCGMTKPGKAPIKKKPKSGMKVSK